MFLLLVGPLLTAVKNQRLLPDLPTVSVLPVPMALSLLPAPTAPSLPLSLMALSVLPAPTALSLPLSQMADRVAEVSCLPLPLIMVVIMVAKMTRAAMLVHTTVRVPILFCRSLTLIATLS